MPPPGVGSISSGKNSSFFAPNASSQLLDKHGRPLPIDPLMIFKGKTHFRGRHPPPPPQSEFAKYVAPSPNPPPPPARHSPPPPPLPVIGRHLGLEIKITGDPITDAHNVALVDALHIIINIWIPIACSGVALVLFFIHNCAVNAMDDRPRGDTTKASKRKGEKAGERPPPQSVMGCLCGLLGCTNETLETVNLLAVALCYMLCAFSYLTFNKLVLLSIPMPCLVAAIQMGATCVLLLIVNGAVGALCHSRTSRIVRASVADALMLVVDVCYKAVVTVCCIKTEGDSPFATRKGGGTSKSGGDGGESGGGGHANGDPSSSLDPRDVAQRDCCFSAGSPFGLTFCGMRKWVGIKVGSTRDVQRWAKASCLYAGTTLFLILALKDSTVTALVVWRQIAPLPTMMAERLLTNAVYRSTCSSTFGLLCIAVGVICYSVADYEFSWIGTLFAVLSTVLMVWEGLYKRRELTNAADPLVMSLQAMVLLNNLVGCALALLLVVSYEIWTSMSSNASLFIMHRDEALYLTASIILSATYHYMGLQLARAVSATSLLAATNAAKIAIVIFGAFCLGDTHTELAWAGVFLAVFGNIIYMLARLQVMRAQGLRQTTATHEGARDFSDSIRAPDNYQPTSVVQVGVEATDGAVGWLKTQGWANWVPGLEPPGQGPNAISRGLGSMGKTVTDAMGEGSKAASDLATNVASASDGGGGRQLPIPSRGGGHR